jgi:hypothetical protein
MLYMKPARLHSVWNYMLMLRPPNPSPLMIVLSRDKKILVEVKSPLPQLEMD